MAAGKIIAFINSNGFYDKFQPGFRAGHSTKTALLQVVGFVVEADSGQSSVFFLLDLTAAFADHLVYN